MSEYLRWVFRCPQPQEPTCHGCEAGWSVERCHPDQPGAHPENEFRRKWATP